MIDPKPADWYVWADSPQSDHLIAHWYNLPSKDIAPTRCGMAISWVRDLRPATFHRHCKLCERALAKEKKA